VLRGRKSIEEGKRSESVQHLLMIFHWRSAGMKRKGVLCNWQRWNRERQEDPGFDSGNPHFTGKNLSKWQNI